MSLKTQINKLKGTWTQFIAIGVWIASVASSLLLPLPSWELGYENESYTKFILFFSTVIAGFIVIMTFKLINKKVWLLISLLTFCLFVAFFFTYSLKRESSTALYDKTTIIIGNEHVSNFNEHFNAIKESLSKIDNSELLKCVGGNANLIWTDESISNNRLKLIIYLMLCYTFLSVFMISFSNYIRLMALKNKKK